MSYDPGSSAFARSCHLLPTPPHHLHPHLCLDPQPSPAQPSPTSASISTHPIVVAAGRSPVVIATCLMGKLNYLSRETSWNLPLGEGDGGGGGWRGGSGSSLICLQFAHLYPLIDLFIALFTPTWTRCSVSRPRCLSVNVETNCSGWRGRSWLMSGRARFLWYTHYTNPGRQQPELSTGEELQSETGPDEEVLRCWSVGAVFVCSNRAVDLLNALC